MPTWFYPQYNGQRGTSPLVFFSTLGILHFAWIILTLKLWACFHRNSKASIRANRKLFPHPILFLTNRFYYVYVYLIVKHSKHNLELSLSHHFSQLSKL